MIKNRKDWISPDGARWFRILVRSCLVNLAAFFHQKLWVSCRFSSIYLFSSEEFILSYSWWEFLFIVRLDSHDRYILLAKMPWLLPESVLTVVVQRACFLPALILGQKMVIPNSPCFMTLMTSLGFGLPIHSKQTLEVESWMMKLSLTSALLKGLITDLAIHQCWPYPSTRQDRPWAWKWSWEPLRARCNRRLALYCQLFSRLRDHHVHLGLRAHLDHRGPYLLPAGRELTASYPSFGIASIDLFHCHPCVPPNLQTIR